MVRASVLFCWPQLLTLLTAVVQGVFTAQCAARPKRVREQLGSRVTDANFVEQTGSRVSEWCLGRFHTMGAMAGSRCEEAVRREASAARCGHRELLMTHFIKDRWKNATLLRVSWSSKVRGEAQALV